MMMIITIILGTNDDDCVADDLLLRSSTGGTPINDATCVCDRLFNSSAAWAATFRLQGIMLMMMTTIRRKKYPKHIRFVCFIA